ncbi:MAG: hypothetical protein U0L05_04450 [Schaedlerella sp.]|nr:hypothetical protein [Schaedlerella sp.]
MKKNPYFVNIILSILTLLICLAGVIVRSFCPHVILPGWDILMMVAISALSCAIVYYVNQGYQSERIGASLLAGFNFSVLPLCAGFTFAAPVWKLFVVGAAVFFVTDLCYESFGRRMDTGAFSKLAPLANAVMLFLAGQCFQNIFF